MDTKFEAMLNGGTDYLPQDSGEWKEIKSHDMDEEEKQQELELWRIGKEEADIYGELPVGMY